jgi:hypothetical protein
MGKKSHFKYTVLHDVLNIGYTQAFFSIFKDFKTDHKSQIEKMKFKA